VINDKMDINVWLRKQLEAAEPDLLREMVQTFAEVLMSADADEACGAPYRVVSPDRVNRRNGYRTRRWDTRVGRAQAMSPVGPRMLARRVWRCVVPSHRVG
jgi:transposase-like protein